MSRQIGIALSGGGYRGVAHVGVLQYLEEIDLNISHVAGTSAGAIVGSLYAAGKTPEGILQVFKETELFEISLLRWNGPGLLNTPKFSDQLTPYFEEDNFDTLERELIIVATDLLAGEEVHLTSGSIVESVLASAAFPGIFAPVEINDRLLVDGGVFNNIPADVLAKKVDVVIGSNVNPINAVKPEQVDNTYEVLKRTFELATRQQSIRQKDFCSVFLAPEEAIKFPLFQRDNVDDLFTVGYEEAKRHHDALKKLAEKAGE
jgi:NTE family protein